VSLAHRRELKQTDCFASHVSGSFSEVNTVFDQSATNFSYCVRDADVTVEEETVLTLLTSVQRDEAH
jgi:hypothetical protein